MSIACCFGPSSKSGQAAFSLSTWGHCIMAINIILVPKPLHNIHTDIKEWLVALIYRTLLIIRALP
jgi:hypothetical protein